MKKNLSIILVDDDSDIHLLLIRIIKRINPSHEVTSAYDGQTLMNYLFGESTAFGMHRILPDLIILDLTMPEMDGYDILKKIRSTSRFENLKIFVLTSGIYEYDRIKSIAYGCTNFYIKPVDPLEFKAIIEDIFTKMDTPSLDTTVLVQE